MFKIRLQSLLRRWFIAGLLVWLPLGATFLVVRVLAGVLDTSLILVPTDWRPAIPGIGILLSLLLILLTGALAANFIGRRALGWGESLLNRIPLVRSVYGGIKKLTETVFSENSTAFRQPILIQYPRKGIWSIAFVTSEPAGEIQEKTEHTVLIISLGVVAPDVIAKKDPLAAIDTPPIAATPAADPTDGTEDDRAR